MSDFLFHRVSEQEKEQIKKQAKGIMDSFAKRLEKVGEKIPEPLIERDEFEREEGTGKKAGEDFRERFFGNAPNKSHNFILAEKKKW